MNIEIVEWVSVAPDPRNRDHLDPRVTHQHTQDCSCRTPTRRANGGLRVDSVSNQAERARATLTHPTERA